MEFPPTHPPDSMMTRAQLSIMINMIMIKNNLKYQKPSLAHVPSANMEEVAFMIYNAVIHHRVI